MLKRNDDNTYTAVVYGSGEHGDYQERIIRNDVPRDLIIMVDVPYTTDMHLPNAFRHYIAIPDDMFPEAWKDRTNEPLDLQ